MRLEIRTTLSIIAAILIGFAITWFVMERGKQLESAQELVMPSTREAVPDQREGIEEPRAREDHPRRGSPELRGN